MPTTGERSDYSRALSRVFDRDALSAARVRFEAQEPIYAPGDADDAMYWVESGQVKLTMSSESGKDCLIAIYAAGEIFGESCFADPDKRFESATAMRRTVVRRATRPEFLEEVQRASAVGALARHLATRMAERQVAVFDFVTMDAERRLAKALLEFAEKLGRFEDPYLRLEHRISHEELSQIVGTTRPRITAFMQRFRNSGILEITAPRVISVHRAKVREFLQME